MTIDSRSRRTARRMGALVGALALAAPLVGCSGDPEPRVADPTPSATPSTSAPATTAPPADETPEEFVRRWQAAADQAQTTGDVEYLLSISPTCRPCAEAMAAVREIYSDGGSIDVGPSSIRRVKILGTSERAASIEASVRVPKTLVYGSRGQSPQEMPAGEQRVRFSLVREQGRWLMASYARL
ncbi:DUF6318 family protein [Nocardioides sp. R-C-SC26]|uniref:DUF6318 family protein n=1 Tax=Nocardioides sp. R-C-SC26 TaxID=2870414 RepID=UPI001E585838|nr:DUF6318 family protein [Nocardioides sp. R-C-SC26]